MAVTSTSITRPFSDSYLLSYSAEHVAYEIDMFFWLARHSSAALAAPTAADAGRLSNVLIEASVIHLRNIIDFLYLDKPKATDVVATDFFASNVWDSLRPPITPSLDAARIRANKEIAHLTTDRMAGSPPAKAWDFQTFANEIKPLLHLVATRALSSRLSPTVARAIP